MKTARKNGVAVVDDANDAEQWISVWQAAKELGIAFSTVLSRGALGELEIKRFDPPGRVFVSRASVERAKQSA